MGLEYNSPVGDGEMTRKLWLLLLTALLLAGCETQPLAPSGTGTWTAQPGASLPGQAITPTPPSIKDGLTPSPDPASSDYPFGPNTCQGNFYMVWASHELPQLTADLQAAFQEAGLPVSNAAASVFGEDWFEYDQDAQTAAWCYFSRMQTEYYIHLQDGAAQDVEELGALVLQTLGVLDDFSASADPNPQPGLTELIFSWQEQERRLRFDYDEGQKALSRGLTGEALLRFLGFSP